MKKLVLALGLVCLLTLLGIGVNAALSASMYFPIVYKAPATPIPSQTPDPGPILLPNGDFEQGHETWIEYSNLGYPLIRYYDELAIAPHSGKWAAWLGGSANNIEQLGQTVLVTPDRPYISFWLWISSIDHCNFDFAYIFVGEDQIDKHDLCYDHNTNGWVQTVYDLRAYSGQTVDIIISVDTDPSYNSSLYLDDFEFQPNSNP